MQKALDKLRPVPTFKSEIVTVTPTIARAWLDKNISNRAPKRRSVTAYARAMANGAWLLTGDAIRFDKSGNLMDGQHRLLACIESDMPFQTVVIYGLDAASKSVIDTNVVRSAQDTLTMLGQRNASSVVSVIRWLINAKNGYGTARTGKSSNERLTTQDCLTVIENHPMLGSYCSRVKSARLQGVSESGVSWIMYVANTYLDKGDEADAFFEVFPAWNGCPAHTLRERNLREGAHKARSPLEYQQIGLIHAWNLFARMESVNSIRNPKEAWIEGLDRKQIK